MPIDRNEVATMITDALSELESYRQRVTGSELHYARDRRTANETKEDGAQAEARSIDPLLHLLRLRLPLIRPTEYGITVSRRIMIETSGSSDVIRVVLNNLGGQGGPEATFEFPPNDLRFLEEIKRGQNHDLGIKAVYHRTQNGLLIDFIVV